MPNGVPDVNGVEVTEEPTSALAEYGRVPIAFTVGEVLEVEPVDGGLGGFRLVARRLERSYLKDYDADPAHRPAAWPERLDVSRWGVLAAFTAGARAGGRAPGRGERVGGAAVAWGTPGLELAQGRPDLAVLWDLRVAPAWRGRGVGASLLGAAARWAAGRGARQMVIETQNVNVAACRFYARQGCVLGAVHRHAYGDALDEVQLLWYLDLGGVADASAAGAARVPGPG